MGMLIQADTLDDLQAIAELAARLSVMPASASDIASLRCLALSRIDYPHGIEQ